MVVENQAFANRIELYRVTCKPMKSNPNAQAVVWNFYEKIGEMDFRAAWSFLEDSYQARRWQADFARFRVGYDTFSAIHGLQVFMRSSEKHFAVFDAFYEEQLTQPRIESLRVMGDMTIGQVRNDLLKCWMS